jgi:DNA polymerase IV
VSEIHSLNNRKILHIDMDAFYASVEQRDNPELIAKPVVVAWPNERSVVCAASYEARTFGIRSAMSVVKAKQLCGKLIFIPPHFEKYRLVSSQVKKIFGRYTDKIEPLSLDEAYLDVTDLRNAKSATEIAESIRTEIYLETQLTASAGVGPSKFIAKIASDWNKPNGICVVEPQDVISFITPLNVRKIPGVGPATANKLKALKIATVGDLFQLPEEQLIATFGKFGSRLFQLARGQDYYPVRNDRIRKSISVETTFEKDKPLSRLVNSLEPLCERLWSLMVSNNLNAKTVSIKFKTSDFQLLTRSKTFNALIPSLDALLMSCSLILKDNTLPQDKYYRLVGIGLSSFDKHENIPSQQKLL